MLSEGVRVMLQKPIAKVSVLCEEFGSLPTGESVQLFVLENGVLSVGLVNYGARLTSLWVPDRKGKRANVILGCGTLSGYLNSHGAYLGATCGRFANRIAGASIEVDGILYPLSANEKGLHTLHGGTTGFDARIWKATVLEDGLRFSLVSEDGDQGFPGTLHAEVTYRLCDSSLRIQYEYACDRSTVANLTNHAYFNLAGEGSGTISQHTLSLAAWDFLPVDECFLPTGEIAPVENTAFDFRRAAVIGERLRRNDNQLKINRGFNHTFVVADHDGPAAELCCPTTGRKMAVQTSEPGIHLYTAGFLDGSILGPSGKTYGREAGLCLETQRFPDSPHHPEFPSAYLAVGEVYRSEMVFEFSTFDFRETN